MRDPALATTRRAVLGGVLALAAASACDTDDLRPPDSRQSAPPPSTASPPPGSDEALVPTVAEAILGALDQVSLARRDFPRLEPSLAPLTRMHRAHLGVLLPPLGSQTRTAARLPSSPAHALRQVLSAEQGLQRKLAGAAVAAQSGALARLLASMAAAVAQQVAVLPDGVPHGGQR